MAARGKKGISNEMRNTFLVVTVLIITATYDASLNPPNKGDNLLSENYQVSSFPRLSHKTNLPTGGHNPPQEFTDLIDVSSMFWLYNTLTFWVALGLTAYLLPSRTICLFLLITLSLFGSCYMLLVAVVSWKLQYLISPKPLHLSYHALSIVNYSLSTLIAVLVASRIAGYVFCRFVPRRKIFCLVQLLSFLSIASCIVTPAVLNVEFILRIEACALLYMEGYELTYSFLVIAKNKIGYINGSIEPPSETNQPIEYALWNQCNNMILSWLTHSVEPDLAKRVVHASIAQQMWEDFKDQFSQKNAPAIY
ncbi:hypothetical protein SCA6_000384 [Theobroma cacao]